MVSCAAALGRSWKPSLRLFEAAGMESAHLVVWCVRSWRSSAPVRSLHPGWARAVRCSAGMWNEPQFWSAVVFRPTAACCSAPLHRGVWMASAPVARRETRSWPYFLSIFFLRVWFSSFFLFEPNFAAHCWAAAALVLLSYCCKPATCVCLDVNKVHLCGPLKFVSQMSTFCVLHAWTILKSTHGHLFPAGIKCTALRNSKSAALRFEKSAHLGTVQRSEYGHKFFVCFESLSWPPYGIDSF
jgi:hypothetical protein